MDMLQNTRISYAGNGRIWVQNNRIWAIKLLKNKQKRKPKTSWNHPNGIRSPKPIKNGQELAKRFLAKASKYRDLVSKPETFKKQAKTELRTFNFLKKKNCFLLPPARDGFFGVGV